MVLDLEIFNPEFTPIEINHGDNGVVFRIGKNHAAKVLYSGDYDSRVFLFRESECAALNLFNEYGIGKILFENNRAVPQPIGVFKIPLGYANPPGFVMEYICGKRAMDLKEPQYSLAIKQADEELRQVEMLGFCPIDATPRNILWEPSQEKAYLIDYASWIRNFSLD